jgi:hypothetical protein
MTTSLPSGQVKQPYSSTLAASGGKTPYAWSVTGLPAGLTLNASTGAISGTPTKVGTSIVSVRATDSSQPAQTATATLTLTVNTPLTITTSSLAAGTVGQPYSPSLAASGGVSPYTWAITSGSLPVGCNLNPATGAITGTPTVAGTSSITVAATDSATPSSSASKTFTLTVNPAKLLIATSSLPPGNVNQPYSVTLTATGGTSPYTWSTGSKLPAGLTLNASTGLIRGTPTKTGTSTLTIKVTDSARSAQTATISLALKIST